MMSKSLKKQKSNFVSSRFTSGRVTKCKSIPLEVDNSCVADATGFDSTLCISDTQKEIFMERFQVELLQRFRFQLAVDVQMPHNDKNDCPILLLRKRKQQLSDTDVDSNNEDLPCHHSDWSLLRSCIVVGTNACTKLFQPDATRNVVIRLMVMCADVDHAVVGHLYRLGNHYQIPTIVLPGSNPSRELGRALGIRRASVMVLCLPSCLEEEKGIGSNDIGKAVAAFIELVSVYVTRKTTP